MRCFGSALMFSAMLSLMAALHITSVATTAASEIVRPDPFSGSCSALKDHQRDVGVKDAEGNPHQGRWGITVWKILTNGMTISDLTNPAMVNRMDELASVAPVSAPGGGRRDG